MKKIILACLIASYTHTAHATPQENGYYRDPLPENLKQKLIQYSAHSPQKITTELYSLLNKVDAAYLQNDVQTAESYLDSALNLLKQGYLNDKDSMRLWYTVNPNEAFASCFLLCFCYKTPEKVKNNRALAKQYMTEFTSQEKVSEKFLRYQERFLEKTYMLMTLCLLSEGNISEAKIYFDKYVNEQIFKDVTLAYFTLIADAVLEKNLDNLGSFFYMGMNSAFSHRHDEEKSEVERNKEIEKNKEKAFVFLKDVFTHADLRLQRNFVELWIYADSLKVEGYMRGKTLIIEALREWILQYRASLASHSSDKPAVSYTAPQ